MRQSGAPATAPRVPLRWADGAEQEVPIPAVNTLAAIFSLCAGGMWKLLPVLRIMLASSVPSVVTTLMPVSPKLVCLPPPFPHQTETACDANDPPTTCTRAVAMHRKFPCAQPTASARAVTVHYTLPLIDTQLGVANVSSGSGFFEFSCGSPGARCWLIQEFLLPNQLFFYVNPGGHLCEASVAFLKRGVGGGQQPAQPQ